MRRHTLPAQALHVTLGFVFAGMSTWSYAGPAYGQVFDASLEAEPLPAAAGQIVQEGLGYQLIESDPSLTDGDSVSDETGQPVQMPPGPRRVWVFDNWQGVENAPIPADLKADLAEEYNGAPGTVGEAGTWMMDEAAALVALAAVDEAPSGVDLPPGGAPGPDVPRQLEFSLCGKKKKTGTQSRTITVTPSVIEREVPGGKIRANLNQSGQITATIVYTKKSRCGIPYGVKVDRVDISGTLELPGSEIGYTGTLRSELPDVPIKLFEVVSYYSFYVGPIRIVISPSARAVARLKLTSEAQVSAGLRAPFNGRYSFAYSCTKSGCTEQRPFESFFETAPDPAQLVGSVSARVVLRPSIDISASVDGFIYIKKLRFFRAELGTNLAIPAELWLYVGNTCGDADGDGLNESVRGATFDISGELYAYAELKYFGFETVRSVALNLPVPWVRRLVPDVLSARAEKTYRRSFFYRDLEPGGSTALSPLIVSAPTLPQRQSMITLRMRPCVPVSAPNVDYLVDFGQEGSQTFTGSPAGVTITHDWQRIGSQPLSARIVRDALQRNIDSPASSRTVNIEASPCTFNGTRVANGGSVQAFQSVNVPFGATCASEQRVCTNGVLTGSFTASTCTVGPPLGCAFDGRTIAHGQSVTAYQNLRVLVCEPCMSETRTCNNGVLSGSYGFGSCTRPPRRPGHQCE
jgi:hypothetical protein